MFRWLLLLHRYLGISLGGLLIAWCLSGVVMMYVAYPSLGPDQQIAGLKKLDLKGCCELDHLSIYESLLIDDFRIEMLLDQPVVRVTTNFGPGTTIDLNSGEPIDGISASEANRIATDFQRHSRLEGDLRYLGLVERDQWTVTIFSHQPLHHFALNDSRSTEWYISSRTGEVVQLTTASQRFWGWLGPVIHWLYPTQLRQNVRLWLQIVILTSLMGCFLTMLGLYIGVVQFRRRRNNQSPPYHGLPLWHHYLGLAFGVLTLTWLASGLLSVQPWGLFESEGFSEERLRTRNISLSLPDIRDRLETIASQTLPADTVRLQSVPFDGKMFYLSYTSDGSVQRLDADTLNPEPLTEQVLARVSANLRPEETIAKSEILYEGDSYYFSHHAKRSFPVYRVILNDAERSRYYLDSVSGQILRKIDNAARSYRWLFEGVHRFDFSTGLRKRPLWDLIMWVLMLGVTGVCFTGTWMGVRYLRHQFR